MARSMWGLVKVSEVWNPLRRDCGSTLRLTQGEWDVHGRVVMTGRGGGFGRMGCEGL